MHRDPGADVLSEGGVGFVQAHLRRLHKNHLARSEDGKVETQVVFWCCDNAELVPVIKGWTQAGKTAKVGGSEAILDASSREPLPAGQAFQYLLRAAGNRDRTTRGIRDFILRYPDRDDSIPATVVFCGIGDRSTTAECAPHGTPAKFSQGRGRHLTRGSLSDIDPRIEECEMSTVHFVVNYDL